MRLRSLENVELTNKTILYRSPYDIGVKRGGNGDLVIEDDARIKATIPTLKYLLERNCKIAILTWVKRPNGKVVKELSTRPHAKALSSILNRQVKHINESVGITVQNAVHNMQPGDILMLENTRFHKEEMEDNDEFAKKLTTGFDLIVFDAFPQSHRIHASTTGILRHLPSYAGFYLLKEVKALGGLLNNVSRPFTFVVGGAKISDKIGAIQNLLPSLDHVLTGGSPGNVFLKAQGVNIGASYIEEDTTVSQEGSKDWTHTANKLMEDSHGKIMVPDDAIIGDNIENPTKTESISSPLNIPTGMGIYDIGAKTTEKYAGIVGRSKTVFWSGPLGVFERPAFENATKSISKSISQISKNGATSIVAGGDTITALKKYGDITKISHISLAGGATLHFLAGDELPALKPLCM